MGKYVVTEGQNLYDIALHLTGSIEGIFFDTCKEEKIIRTTYHNSNSIAA